MGALRGKRILLIALFLSGAARAEVPDCYRLDGGRTYFIRTLLYEQVQAMDDTQRRLARTYESIAGLIGPCVKPDGTVFHMVDRPRTNP